FFNDTSRLPIRKICGAALLLSALSGFLSLFPSLRLGVLIRSYNGGAVGRLLEEALAGIMGTAGAASVLIVASVLTLMLRMEISLVRTGSLVRRLRRQRLEAQRTETQPIESPSIEPASAGSGLFARARSWITERSQERRAEAARRRDDELVDG